MSNKDYTKALTYIENNYQYISSNCEQTKALIEEIQTHLNVKFSPQHFNFLKEYGYITFNNNVILGITCDSLTKHFKNNLVTMTNRLRKSNNLKELYIPINQVNDNEIHILDYVNIIENEEPKIISISLSDDDYKVNEIIASDFGEYLLTLI